MMASSDPEKGGVIRGLSRRNRDKIGLLDDAYISARYFPSLHTKGEAGTLVRIAEQLRRFVARRGKR